MKSTTTFSVGSLLLVATLVSCAPENKTATTADSVFAARPAAASVADANSLDIIFLGSFRGIAPGDKMAVHEANLVKSELVTGEGDFTVYLIMDEPEGKIGYLMPDPDDETKVGDITITSSIPTTTEGMKVGMTLGDLFNRYRNLEIHGSEIGGRTTAYKGQLSFRIDANNYEYEIDPEKIPLNAKITEISINRSPEK